MAASFPFLHSTNFLFDSDFLQNNTSSIPAPKMPYSLMDDIINSNNCFYNNYQLPSHDHDHDHEILHHQEMDASCRNIHHDQAAGNSSVENNKIIRSPLSSHDENYEQSMSEKYKTTPDSSSMVIQLNENDDDDDEQEIHKKNTTDHQKKRRKNRDGSCLISGQPKDLKETKGKRQKKCNGGLQETDELKKKAKVEKKNQKVVSDEVPPTGYIHVRARRGQATDSHSLAERVRREKISERMKLLQSLVPGCDRVTGKALMLDEIINYVQSLQNQVEFLSMKLSSVNHPVFHDFGAADLDAFMVKSEKMSSNLVSPLPSMQQSSTSSTTTPADQLTAFADTTTTFTTRHNCPSLEFQQSHTSNGFSSQVNENLLMDVDVDDQSRQMFINQSWFNHLCSFQ